MNRFIRVLFAFAIASSAAGRIGAEVTRLPFGLPPPVFSDSPDGGQGKIVDGNRICNELGFEYQYPDPLVMPME